MIVWKWIGIEVDYRAGGTYTETVQAQGAILFSAVSRMSSTLAQLVTVGGGGVRGGVEALIGCT